MISILDVFKNFTSQKERYQDNQEKYLFVEISDSIFAKIHTRETIIKTKKISGIINSSLWFALEDAGLSTDLEIDAVLDEITAKLPSLTFIALTSPFKLE